MDLQLKGKTALVSGSSAGIGFAIVKALAAEGACVIVNGRTQQRVSAAITALRKEVPGAELKPLAADLGTKAGADAAIKAYPDVDILVNNLGIYAPKPFERITDEDWSRIFEVNVMSGVRLSRHYLPVMLARNAGRIIFISSESGIATPAEMIDYGFSKTAQLALMRGMAELTAGSRVTVNAVLPGPTRSEGVEKFIADNAAQQQTTPEKIEAEFFTRMRPASLIKRFAEPDEVASMVAYVASPLSSATNGAALRVEGGIIKTIY